MNPQNTTSAKPAMLLVSFLLSLFMWINISGRRADAEDSQVQVFPQIPLLHLNIPEDMKLKAENYQIRVTLEGQDQELESINPTNDIKVRLDLGRLQPGTYNLPLTADNVILPTNLTSLSVRNIIPDVVKLTLEHHSTKEVPLSLPLVGRLAPNFEIVSRLIQPAKVTISGPTQQISDVEKLIALPVSVQGATQKLEGQVQFDLDAKLMSDTVISGVGEIRYTIDIQEKKRRKLFNRKLKVVFPEGSPQAKLIPGKVQLDIFGPISAVEMFKSEWVIPEVLIPETIEEGPMTRGTDEPEPNDPNKPDEPEPVMVIVSERWVIPNEIKDAIPDLQEKLDQLVLSWIPTEVEVKQK